jgi:bisphosphoglycerate-dependent phosphoglycerate mutase
MNLTKNQTHVQKVEEYIYKCLQKGELTNENLVQIIERINPYLNLKTIQNYANDNKISYNGAKNNRTVVSLFGCKFIADND